LPRSLPEEYNSSFQEGTASQRTDMVFDVYRGNSINNPEKEKRDSESGHKFRGFKADHRTHQ